MPTTMVASIQEAQRWLTGLITDILYPVVILAILGYVIISIIVIVGEARDTGGSIRRSFGALIPVVVLVFMVTTTPSVSENLQAISAFPEWAKFGLGAVLGVGVLQLGNYLSGSDGEIGGAIYALLLSAVGTFLIYMFLMGHLAALHYFFFGLVVFGLLNVVFFGLPKYLT